MLSFLQMNTFCELYQYNMCVSPGKSKYIDGIVPSTIDTMSPQYFSLWRHYVVVISNA